MIELLLAAVVVIFQAGGIFYLAKNHFAHVNKKLDKLDARLQNLDGRVYRIEGALGAVRRKNLTEH